MPGLSFHAAGKTSCKMQKLAREIYVQVKEKIRESQGAYFEIFGGKPIFLGGGGGGPNIFGITLHSWCNTFYDLVLPFMSFLPKSYIHM